MNKTVFNIHRRECFQCELAGTAACSSTCMEEVTTHCVPNIQCKKADVSTLAAAAQKCQEAINAQNTGIKAKCPAPCSVSAEVLNQAGACPGNNGSNDQTDRTPKTDQAPNRMRIRDRDCLGDELTCT